MLKLNQVVLAFLLSILAMGAHAQGKIAVVDLQRAMVATELFKERMKAFSDQADIVASQKQVEKMRADGQKLLETLKNDGAVMGDEQKKELESKIQNLQADIQHEGKKMMAAQQQVVGEIQREIAPRLQQALDAIIKEEGIGLLLGSPTHPQIPQLSQIILHMDSSYDITAKLTDRLNKSK